MRSFALDRAALAFAPSNLAWERRASAFAPSKHDPRQHQRVTPIALAFVLINRPHLARIGHNHFPTQPFQVSTDPWAMRSGFQHGQGPTVTGSQSGQASSIVTQSAFLLHFAFAIERTKPVPAFSQI